MTKRNNDILFPSRELCIPLYSIMDINIETNIHHEIISIYAMPYVINKLNGNEEIIKYKFVVTSNLIEDLKFFDENDIESLYIHIAKFLSRRFISQAYLKDEIKERFNRLKPKEKKSMVFI
jgi:hypothetical protein